MSEDAHERIIDLIAEEPVALATFLADRYRAEMPSYRRLDPDSVREGLPDAVALTVAALRARRPLSLEERAWLTAHGERRARLGIPLEDMVRGYRVAQRALMRRARAACSRAGIGEPALLDFGDALGEILDQVAVATAEGHRRVQPDRALLDGRVSAGFVHAVLLGGLDPAELRAQATALGLGPDRPYVPFRAPAGEDPAQTLALLGVPRTLGAPRGAAVVLAGDLAGFLVAAPSAEAPLVCGVGPAAPLEQLSEAFAVASRALRVAEAFGRRGAVRLDQLGVLPAVLDDREVGEALLDRFVRRVLAEPGGDALLDSVGAFLEARSHTATAAAALHVHPNTLRHRLQRFEALTGADLDQPDSVVEVWWALRRHVAVPRHNA